MCVLPVREGQKSSKPKRKVRIKKQRCRAPQTLEPIISLGDAEETDEDSKERLRSVLLKEKGNGIKGGKESSRMHVESNSQSPHVHPQRMKPAGGWPLGSSKVMSSWGHHRAACSHPEAKTTAPSLPGFCPGGRDQFCGGCHRTGRRNKRPVEGLQ